MNTKQPEALTLAQKLENAPAWESQSPTIYGWNDSGETLADAAAELRRLHSDYETLRCKQQTLEELCADVQLLRLGYAAARQEIANLRVQPYDQQAMGLCHVCGWKGVIDYPDGPVCVACEHDKQLAPQPTAQAQEDARLPLTDDEAFKAYTAATGQKLLKQGPDRQRFLQAFRLAENAHGITDQQGETA